MDPSHRRVNFLPLPQKDQKGSICKQQKTDKFYPRRLDPITEISDYIFYKYLIILLKQSTDMGFPNARVYMLIFLCTAWTRYKASEITHTISKAACDEGVYLDLEYQHSFYSNESSNSEGAKQNKTKVWDTW